MNIDNFKYKVKKNKFILFGLIDQENNMYKATTTKDGRLTKTSYEFTHNVPEFLDRIKELAYGCEVIIDEEFLEANNYLPVTDKTTIVLCDSVSYISSKVIYKHRRNMVFHRKRDFLELVKLHETRRKTPLFISVQPKLIIDNQLEYLIDVIEYIRVNKTSEIEDNQYLIDFNIKELKRYANSDREFTTKESIELNDKQTKFDNSTKGKLTKVVGNIKVTETVESDGLLGFTYSFHSII